VWEITFADKALKPQAILMLERIKIDGINEIGFINASIVRHYLSKIPQILNNGKGTEFDTI
jgi:hypothetical protein